VSDLRRCRRNRSWMIWAVDHLSILAGPLFAPFWSETGAGRRRPRNGVRIRSSFLGPVGAVGSRWHAGRRGPDRAGPGGGAPQPAAHGPGRHAQLSGDRAVPATGRLGQQRRTDHLGRVGATRHAGRRQHDVGHPAARAPHPARSNQQASATGLADGSRSGIPPRPGCPGHLRGHEGRGIGPHRQRRVAEEGRGSGMIAKRRAHHARGGARTGGRRSSPTP
jgi:hypothetical protein